VRKPLIPDSAKSQFLLLWVSVLPQFFLLLYNLRAFWVVRGECTHQGRTLWRWVIAFEIAMILGTGALALVLRWRRRLVSWQASWALLIPPILYLWLVTQASLGTLLPASVTAWILPVDQFLYYQFALMMPVIFYATVRLACVDIRFLSPSVEAVVIAGAVTGPPLFWLVVPRGFQWLPSWMVAGCWVFWIVLFLCSAVLLIAGLVRACVAGYLAVRRMGCLAQGVLTFLAGIAGPIGGLWLNSRIPFPADFQSWAVFGMALTNGCLLMLPDFERPWLCRLVWLAQCAFFPFTIYFLLVFLPFLPLSIPAIVLFGSGFLILTPTILFFVHGQRLLDGYGSFSADRKRFAPALLAAGAMAILPGATIAQTLVDRMVLRSAIDYVFSPDYRRADRFHGSRFAVRHSLERLRDFKAGAYQPFLSDFYNWVVFGNLVLPDDKMNQIARAFFGRDLDPAKPDRMPIFGGGRTGRMLREVVPTVEPSSAIALSELSAKTVIEGDCERTTIALKMRNNGITGGEFVTKIRIPNGVFVSGFWLNIGKVRTQGKLFEKKTALWVYQQIRDWTYRDPGIMVYSAPGCIELRIFPFAVGEERHAEIEFFYPAALAPTISIGDRQWRKEPGAPGTCMTLTPDGGAVALPATVAAQLPAAKRAQYLHFIVDRSATSTLKDVEIVSAIRKVAAHFDSASECAVTLANYESVDVTDGIVPLGAVDAGLLQRDGGLPRRGGFLAERAIKRALVAYHDRLSHSTGTGADLRRYPVVVLIGKPLPVMTVGDDLAVFGKFAPDVCGFNMTEDGEKLVSSDFAGHCESAMGKPHPVALLKLGDAVAPCAIDGSETQLVYFDTTAKERALSILDSGSFRALNPAAVIAPGAAYGKGVRALRRHMGWVTNPSLGNNGLSEVVALSRETGILVAATSYIVVENSAQWKMLALKQRQKLGNQAALEFEETPEPGTGLMVVVGAAMLLNKRRRAVHVR